MTLTVSSAESGMRLDSYIASFGDLSRSAAVKLIEGGEVLVNGAVKSKKYAVCEGDSVEIEIPDAEEYTAEPENIPLSIVYEDEDVIVINKPKGMVVHPAPGNYTGTLVNALLYHCRDSLSGIGGVMRPGIVHRIDKDTSGLIVVAKNDAAHRALCEQLAEHGIVREYHALVSGGFSQDSGTVNLPIGRHPKDRKRMAVHSPQSHTAKEAITHYEVYRRYGSVSYLKLRLETGRTHQIRVHMSHLGHPLLGDEVYGGGKTAFEKRHAPLLNGQALHAARLIFKHPRTMEKTELECPLPDYFSELVKILENKQ